MSIRTVVVALIVLAAVCGLVVVFGQRAQ